MGPQCGNSRGGAAVLPGAVPHQCQTRVGLPAVHAHALTAAALPPLLPLQIFDPVEVHLPGAEHCGEDVLDPSCKFWEDVRRVSSTKHSGAGAELSRGALAGLALLRAHVAGALSAGRRRLAGKG